MYKYLQYASGETQSKHLAFRDDIRATRNNQTLKVMLELYQRIKNSHLQKWITSKNITHFKWIYYLQGCNKNGGKVMIVIHETYQGVATSGGSSFTLLIRSKNTMDFCPVMDLFNGTYIAKCPVHEEGSTITAECHFVNFMAFARIDTPKVQTLFEEQVDKYLRKKIEFRIVSELRTCKKLISKHPQRGWWVKVNNRWRWFAGRCLVPIINNTVLAECINSYKRVSIHGVTGTRGRVVSA